MIEQKKHLPCFRYHASHAPRILSTQAELDEAEARGWRDSPGAAAAVVEALPAIDLTMPDDGVDKNP
ncbi:MAG: hypothetical protein ACREVW_02235, partial [Burkholderiales bacterium]